MDRVTTYVPLTQVTSADLNNIQDRALGIYQHAGQLFSRPVVTVDGAGTLSIGAMAGMIHNGGVGSEEVILPQAAPASYIPGGLLASTWYYLYATSVGTGAIVYEAPSTTAPDASLQYKTGDVARIYLAAVRSDASGTPKLLPCRIERGKCFWRRDEISGGYPLFRVLTAGTATAWATVSSALFVPPHARLAILQMELSTTANITGAPWVASIRRTGTTTTVGNHQLYSSDNPRATERWIADIEQELDASQQFDYQIAPALSGGNPTLSVNVIGYYENVP